MLMSREERYGGCDGAPIFENYKSSMDVSLRNFVFVTSVCIPILFWIANAVVRSHRGVPLSSGADLLLLLVVFDLTLLMSVEPFRALAASEDVAKDLPQMFGFLLAVCIVAWLMGCLFVEPALASNYDVARQRFRIGMARYLGAASVWLLVWFIAALHVFAFMGKLK